jgi:hypothetical protein
MNKWQPTQVRCSPGDLKTTWKWRSNGSTLFTFLQKVTRQTDVSLDTEFAQISVLKSISLLGLHNSLPQTFPKNIQFLSSWKAGVKSPGQAKHLYYSANYCSSVTFLALVHSNTYIQMHWACAKNNLVALLYY